MSIFAQESSVRLQERPSDSRWLDVFPTVEPGDGCTMRHQQHIARWSRCTRCVHCHRAVFQWQGKWLHVERSSALVVPTPAPSSVIY